MYNLQLDLRSSCVRDCDQLAKMAGFHRVLIAALLSSQAAGSWLASRESRQGVLVGAGAKHSRAQTLSPRARRYHVDFKNTKATDVLLATNVVAFAALTKADRLFMLLAKSDAAIRRGGVHRFLTPVLLHGSVPPLLVNSLSLMAFRKRLRPT